MNRLKGICPVQQRWITVSISGSTLPGTANYNACCNNESEMREQP